MKKRRWKKWFPAVVFFLFCLLVPLLFPDRAYAKEEEEEIVVWYSSYASRSARYFQHTAYETNEFSQGGDWYGQYWDGSKWVAYTSNNIFGAGKNRYETDIRVTNIAGAKPTLQKSTQIRYSYGTTYICQVSAQANNAPFQFRLFTNWNVGEKNDLFDSMKGRGYAECKIMDPVVGYYYTINRSGGNSLGNVAGAYYQESASIPFDITDRGKYLHVKAKSYTGKLSDELVVPLKMSEEKRPLSVACGTGIAKVTAVGAVSGTTVTAVNAAGAKGNFYPGETITLTMETVSNGTFTGWNLNRGVSYRSGYSAGTETTKFIMPNGAIKATAEGKLYHRITVQAGQGIQSVVLNGKEMDDSGKITAICYEGDRFTLQAEQKQYYKKPDWKATPASYSQTEQTGLTAVMGTSDITYTVSAQKEIYQVSYNGLSGASPDAIEGISDEGGSKQKITAVVPTKPGFTFQGWKCTTGPDDMKNKIYTADETYELKGNLVFTAQWTADQYTVKLHTGIPDAASSAVEHAKELRTSEGIELKDATSEQIQASGVGNFGEVTSTKETSSRYQIISGEAYRISSINWKYCNTGAKVSDVSIFTWGQDSAIWDVQNIVYDHTTQKYYMAGKATDTFAWAQANVPAGSIDYGTASSLLAGCLYQPSIRPATVSDYKYSQSWVCLGSSYKIYTDIIETVELKDATSEQIEKYTSLPGFATMCMTVPNRDNYGSEIYYYDWNYSFKGFDSERPLGSSTENHTLTWIYSGRMGLSSLPTYLYQFYHNSSSDYYHCNFGFSANHFSGGLNQSTEGKLKAGTVIYDTASKGYYMYNGYGRDAFRENRTGESWVYLGTSYKISIPNTWDWVDTDTSKGEGYYVKTFTKFSTAVLPQVTDTSEGAFSLKGWNASAWKNLDGQTYEPGTRLSEIPVTGEKTLDLYADWTANTYTIRYMGNGGETESGDIWYDVEYQYDKTYVWPKCVFNRQAEDNGTTTYRFTAWYSNSGLNGPALEEGESFQNLSSRNGARIYRYAGWSTDKIAYSIRFHSNGAKEQAAIADMTGLGYTDKVRLPDTNGYYTYAGYEFAGWCREEMSYEEWQNADVRPQVYGTDREVYGLGNKNGQVVDLYALWKPAENQTYTIKYDGNGADSGEMQDQVVFCGTTTYLNPNIFGKTNYAFTGWNTKADGSGIAKADKDCMDFSAGNGDCITLYAQWKPEVYYVEYDGNDADFGEMEQSVFVYDTEEKLLANSYEKIGYHTETANTWNTKADGTGTGYAEEAVVNNLTGRSTNKQMNKVRLYVQWVPNQYTLHYDGNGADSGKMQDQVKTWGTSLDFQKNNYSREGYEFLGWSLEADGSGGLYPDGYCLQQDLTEEHQDVLTLYAQWKDVESPVFVDEDGNKISEDEVTLGWTNEDVMFRYSAEDLGSGLKELVLKDENGKVIMEHSSLIKKKVSDEGVTRFTLTAEDNSGNKSSLKINVLIDKTKPVIVNEESFTYPETGRLQLQFHTSDQGGSGLKQFSLYSSDKEGSAASLVLLKEAAITDTAAADLAYEFIDDMISDSMYYMLLAEDCAGNRTTQSFHIDASTGISGKAWKYDKTTVTDDTLVLPYIQHGDMRTWFEIYLNGYLTEVTYDFDDDLNALGVADVTHALQPAANAVDHLEIELPTTMVYDHIYTVTIRGTRQQREVSMKLYLKYVEMTEKPHVSIRYQNGMAMPKDGGEWLDYEKLAREEKERIRRYRESLMELPENMRKQESE